MTVWMRRVVVDGLGRRLAVSLCAGLCAALVSGPALA